MGINILIADDHAIWRKNIRLILEEESDLKIVGEAKDGYETIQEALNTTPDLILMDITMPKLNGIDAMRKIRMHFPQIKVLILTMHSNKQFVDDAFKYGASGYVLKNSAVSEIVSAIRNIVKGKCYISTDLEGYVIKDWMH